MSNSPLKGHGKRGADVLEFENGEVYIDELNRHSGRVVGPFSSTADAEKFIVGTPWFRSGSE